MAYKLQRTGDNVRDLLNKIERMQPPKVMFGRWWLYSEDLGRYFSTPLTAKENDNNLWQLTESGQTIQHNFNTYPSVMVMAEKDGVLQQIFVNIAYPDKNTIRVSWNGDMTVYVYII